MSNQIIVGKGVDFLYSQNWNKFWIIKKSYIVFKWSVEFFNNVINVHILKENKIWNLIFIIVLAYFIFKA